MIIQERDALSRSPLPSQLWTQVNVVKPKKQTARMSTSGIAPRLPQLQALCDRAKRHAEVLETVAVTASRSSSLQSSLETSATTSTSTSNMHSVPSERKI